MTSTSGISRKQAYSLIMAYVLTFFVILGGIIYVNYTVGENNRKWCTLLVTLDSAYKQVPPKSHVGSNVAHQIHELRIDFGC